jgi:hypothetical protein
MSVAQSIRLLLSQPNQMNQFCAPQTRV